MRLNISRLRSKDHAPADVKAGALLNNRRDAVLAMFTISVRLFAHSHYAEFPLAHGVPRMNTPTWHEAPVINSRSMPAETETEENRWKVENDMLP